MVKAIHSAAMDGLTLWDVSFRVGPGSQGDDVRLVQYLMARFVQYDPVKPPSTPGLTLADVDGVWGPRTTAAMQWLEKNGGVVADGVVDPCPLDTLDVGGPYSSTMYKIAMLQWYYIPEVAKRIVFDGPGKSAILMDMANDGQCPADLAWALESAKATLNIEDQVKKEFP